MVLRDVRAHRLTALAVAVLHAAAAGLAIVLLSRRVLYQDVLRIGIGWWGRNTLAGLLTVLATALLLAGVVGLAVGELRRTIGRLRRGEPEPDVLLRARALLVVTVACVAVDALLLSTPETLTGPFRLRYPVTGWITAALAYGVFALWYRKLPRIRRVLPGTLAGGFDILVTNVALVLVLAEGTLRVAAHVWPSPLLDIPSTPSQVRRDAHREPPGTLRFGFPMNRGGHYDTEFLPSASVPGAVVVSIGDSFSYGAVPHAYHFTTVAEQDRPGVEIYNMGYSGIGPSDYLQLLKEEALPLKPDAIVVEIFVGNDISEGLTPAGPARWHDGDSYLVAIVWHRLRTMRKAQLTDVAAAQAAGEANLKALNQRYPFFTDPLLETPSVARDVFMEVETRNAKAICMPNDAMYDRFFGLLSEMKRAAGDVPLKFVLIPEEFQVEDSLWTEVLRASGQPLDRDLPQRKVGDWLAARGLPVLDLLPLLRAVEPLADGRRHVYHLQNLHFNVRGNAIAGHALAAFLGPLPATRLPLQLEFGKPTTQRVLRGGWSAPEGGAGDGFVWSEGIESGIVVPLPRIGDVRMDFDVLPFAYPGAPPQEVTVTLNGAVVGTQRLEAARHRYSIVLPGTALVDSTDTIRFRYAYARAPRDVLSGSPDARHLGVAWFAIAFSPSLGAGAHAPASPPDSELGAPARSRTPLHRRRRRPPAHGTVVHRTSPLAAHAHRTRTVRIG